MCSHYQAETRRRQLEKMGLKLPPSWVPPPGGMHIYPTYLAPLIRRPAHRARPDEVVPDLEIVNGHFGMLPPFAADVTYIRRYRTHNARTETVAKLPSFKRAWNKPLHCIIPCEAIYESDWRTDEHIPTRFTAANDEALGVAGIWCPWRNPVTSVWEQSFSMLTINADDHPMFKLMHRTDPSKALFGQDKRMVVILPEAQFEAWLDASPQDSMEFMRQFPAEGLVMMPERVPPQAPKVKAKRRQPPPEQAQLF